MGGAGGPREGVVSLLPSLEGGLLLLLVHCDIGRVRVDLFLLRLISTLHTTYSRAYSIHHVHTCTQGENKILSTQNNVIQRHPRQLFSPRK